MLSGLLLAIWAKLTLRRSFGLAAANRGTVIAGPYRMVRHPMYAAYIIGDIGFFLNNPLLWNMCLYIVAILALVLRILAEEAILTADPAYHAYRGRIRYRLLPAFF
jgi:protein-S-isoprenylcysteine O-methyltransferase Ste14